MSWFSAGALRRSFEHTPRTMALVAKASSVGTGVMAVLTLVAAGLPLAVAWVGKAIVDAVVAGNEAASYRLVLIELALIAALALNTRGLGLLRQQLGARLAVDLHLAILDKARELDLAHFEDSEFYDSLTRARREASSRPVSVVVETFSLVQHAITLSGYVLLLVRYSGWAVVLLAVAAIPATVAEIKFSDSAFRMRNWRSPDARKLNYLEVALANDGHAKEVRAFNLGRWLLERYRTLAERFYREDRSLALRRAGWAASLSLLGTCAFYALYAVMAIAAARGDIGLGDLVLYVAAFRQGQQSFQSILAGVGGMYEHNLYMSNLFSYLDAPTSSSLTIEQQTDAKGAYAGEKGIRFDHVSYRYAGTDKLVLHDVDLFIPEGQNVALVGSNGAGKSTFIKLLMRLYDPTEGAIYLDGKDLRSWEAEELSQRMSAVFQDFVQYQFTVGDNIGVGHLPHREDEERIREAADRGGASPIVESLDHGFDTQLGRWFKDGAQLSGGQWQKIALARAFMREEADVLILDEPTAALDAEAEHALFERFRQLTKGRTSFLISHRFPTVKMADRIIVLSGGAVVEDGSHAELVEQAGLYARMYTLQAAGYLNDAEDTAA